jgi:tubulin epsilon
LPSRLAGLPFSLLCLANNCGIGATFAAMQQRFQQLYPRRLYTHHYQQYIEVAEFDAALEAAAWLTDSYQQLNDALPPDLARLRPQDASSFGQNSLRRAQLAAAAGAAGWRGR